MRTIMMTALLASLIVQTGAAELQYYRTSVYPGAKPRSDVEAPEVITHPAPAGELARREVKIWPRKGMDIIPVEKNMPLRTWTFMAGVDSDRIWGRKPGVPEAGKDPAYREAYWDRLCSYSSHNVRAGLLMVFVRGYLIPPESGRYTFFNAADDRGSFFLSTDENPENMRPVAWNKEYTRRGNYFFRGPEQVSHAIPLEGGRKYYFEASFGDEGGGYWMSVAWRYQGRLFPEVIDGKYLESLDGKKGFAGAVYYEPAVEPAINPYIAKGTLEAHLIGFRGVGNASIESPKGPRAGRQLPSVTLRLPDGRKRTFKASMFSLADQDYLEQEFIKARKQLYDASDKTPHRLMRAVDMSENVAPGEPGMLNAETDHMSWYAGSQSPPGENSPWINEIDLEEGRIYRERIKAWSENMWLTMEYAGHPPFSWRVPGRQPKYEVTVAGTMKYGYDVIAGFAGGGMGGCIAKDGHTGILAHEWGHGARVGWGGEGGCDTYATFCFPGPMGCPHPSNAPYRNFHGADANMYGMVSFGTLWGDDPNWGHGFHISVPRGKVRHPGGEPDLAFTFARVLEQRGMAAEGDGIRAFGDLAGEYCARLATFDYELEFEFVNAMYMPTLSLVERIDADRPLYRVHSDHEPEACGVNIIRLDAEPGAKDITVDFDGQVDWDDHSDWRAAIVAVGKDGVRRYSRLWNKGKMSLPIEPDDASHFLTVTATPSALTSKDEGVSPTGRFGVTYPWQAEIHGAVPGTSAKRLGDLGTIETSYAGRLLAPRREATATIGRIEDYHSALQKIAASEPENQAEAHKRFYAMLNMTTYQTAMDMLGPGKPHKNGGGWVADTAEVADTAYVGPQAMVMGHSIVRDHAVIEDTAVILGRSDISGHAKVSGGAVLAGKVMGGYARCWDDVQEVDGHVRELPNRAGWDDPHPDGLWANYAMNGDGGIRLNDYFRHNLYGDNTSYHKPLGVSLHGFVYGKPEYVKIDDKWGMRIADAAQFATLNPRAADLGAITLALTLRREKAVKGTVLDLGSNHDNYMVLTLSREGRPEFVAVKDGKRVVTLSGRTSIPLNQWAQVRVEIDGTTARLVVNGKPEATVKTAFRPCDVYLPDVPRRNVLGNSREKNSPLMGVLGELVIYSRVNHDFDALLPPVVNCPIRPSEGALEAVTQYAAFVEAHNDKIKAAQTVTPDSAAAEDDEHTGGIQKRIETGPPFTRAQHAEFYKLLAQRVADRRKALMAKDVDVSGIETELKVREEALKELQAKLGEEARNLPEIQAASAEHKSLEEAWRAEQAEWNQAWREMMANDERYQGLQSELNAIRQSMREDGLERGSREWETREAAIRKVDHRRRMRENAIQNELQTSVSRWMDFFELQGRYYGKGSEVRGMIDSYTRHGSVDLRKEVADVKADIAAARQKAQAPYAPEFRGMGDASGLWGGHYNTPIMRFLGSQGGDKAITGVLPHTDDPDEIQERLNVLPNRWHTKVDWDWRFREEVMGTIGNLPLLQKWIERTRGPVVTEKPEGLGTRR